MSNKLGIFYTCFTEKKAVEYSLKELYKYYPDISRHWLHGKDKSFLELNTSMKKKY